MVLRAATSKPAMATTGLELEGKRAGRAGKWRGTVLRSRGTGEGDREVEVSANRFR